MYLGYRTAYGVQTGKYAVIGLRRGGVSLSGVLINGIAAFIGAAAGILLKKGIPERITKALFSAIALCVCIMGVQGAVKTENLLLLLASMTIGTLLGTVLQLEERMYHSGEWLKNKLGADGDSRFVQGFVVVTIIQVVGAMSILGPVQAALLGDYSLLYFKSVLDGVASIIFGAIYGMGTLPVCIVIVVYEMIFYVLAHLVSPLMTPDVIRELNAVGSVMIFAISLNMLGITKLKVTDYLPALFIPIIYYHLFAGWL